MLLEGLHEGCHRRSLLANGHIDAVYRFSLLIEMLLVDDGVDGDGRLTGLSVADDELTLSAADGNHGVDGFQSCLQRLLHGLAIDYARGLAVQRHFESSSQVDVSLSVDGLSERIDHAAEEVVVDANGSDAMGALHLLPFLNSSCRPEEHASDVVLLQVHHNGHSAILKLKKFRRLHVAQSIDTRHAIGDGEHSTHLVELFGLVDALKFLQKNLRNFAWFNFI